MQGTVHKIREGSMEQRALLLSPQPFPEVGLEADSEPHRMLKNTGMEN